MSLTLWKSPRLKFQIGREAHANVGSCVTPPRDDTQHTRPARVHCFFVELLFFIARHNNSSFHASFFVYFSHLFNRLCCSFSQRVSSIYFKSRPAKSSGV